MRNGARRWRNRGGDRFTPTEFALVTARFALKWSPEQIAGVLRQTGQLAISHETIYRSIWADKRRGGQIEEPIDHVCRTCRGGRYRLLEGDQTLGVPPAAEGFEGEVGQDFTERHGVGARQARVTMRPFGRDVVAVEAAMVV